MLSHHTLVPADLLYAEMLRYKLKKYQCEVYNIYFPYSVMLKTLLTVYGPEHYLCMPVTVGMLILLVLQLLEMLMFLNC